MKKLEDYEFVVNPNTGNTINMKKLLTEQRLALIYIDSNFPFFSTLLRNLTWIYSFQCPTQCTDGYRLIVNPEFTSKLSIKMKAFVMMHEVMHCSLDHIVRGKGHDHNRSNIAADYEVNGLLVADGIVSKSDVKDYLYDEKYVGMSYEHIYSLNPSGPKAPQTQKGGQQGSGSSDSGQDDGQQGSGSGSSSGNVNGNGNSQASEKSRQEAAESCSSVGGFINQQTGADIARSEGYSEDDCRVVPQTTLSQNWKESAIEACSKNNSPGKGYIVSHFKDYYITSHDWKGELKKYVGRALSSIEDETKIGKKKWLAHGEIKKFDRPSENQLDNVVFMIDCSGSVSDKLLQNIISECYTICKKKKIKRVTYCYYDNGIRQMETNDTLKSDGVIPENMVSRIKRGNAKPKADIHGRGGNSEDTAMNELVTMLKKSHRKLELCLWFTDGYTASRPKRPIEVKHQIWVIYDNNNFEVTDDSKVIHIKSEDLGK